MRQISISQLFEDHQDKLSLTWVAAQGAERSIEIRERGNYGADVVGHLNLIHPERLQVIGAAEYQWLSRVNPERLKAQMNEIFAAQPPAGVTLADLALTLQSGREALDARAAITAATGSCSAKLMGTPP